MAYPEPKVGFKNNYVFSTVATGAPNITYCRTFEVTTKHKEHRFEPANTIELYIPEKTGYIVTVTGFYVAGETLPGYGDEIKSVAILDKVSSTSFGIPADLLTAATWGRLVVTVPPDLKLSREVGTWTMTAETGAVPQPTS